MRCVTWQYRRLPHAYTTWDVGLLLVCKDLVAALEDELGVGAETTRAPIKHGNRREQVG